MSEKPGPTFYLTSRELSQSMKDMVRDMGLGCFEKYELKLLKQISADLNGKRVVYVDDESEAFAFVPNALREGGATVTIYESAEEALIAIKDSLPDVLISDFVLGEGMNGMDLADEWIKLSSPE